MSDKIVPENVEFLSDWDGFELPNGVFNKGIPACGATTVAIRDSHKTVICSPRNNLIENKHAQHPETLLVVGSIPEQKIVEYIEKTRFPKILTSYDSLPKVARCIEQKEDWRVVVDEFQYLLSDSSMKSEVEIRLLEQLRNFPYVTYMSATPILSKYLTKIKWLKDLPYLELKWSNVEKIKLIRQESKRPIEAALEIVRCYQQGAYPRLEVNRKIVESKECVIYLNSVNNIVNIIKQTGLKPEDVNIIVGDNEDNKTQIAKLGEGFSRGNIPLKGAPHKMVTLCTSTAFAGCDFYSTCASSYVISDNKSVHTTVDISTDLLQIAGRQRLKENPFRKYLTFVYNTYQFELPEDKFAEQLTKKIKLTELEIDQYNGIIDSELREKRIKDVNRLQKLLGYGESFIMYDRESDRFIMNDLACLNEQYSYELQRHNYKNGIVVRQQLSDDLYDMSTSVHYKEYEEQLLNSIRKESFAERMKRYCMYHDGDRMFDIAVLSFDKQYPQLKEYYDELGSERIKALGYKEHKLLNEILNRNQQSKLAVEFRNIFKSGKRWSIESIKQTMTEVYSRYGIKRKGVASHLGKEYGLKYKEVKIPSDGKRVNGYEFL